MSANATSAASAPRRAAPNNFDATRLSLAILVYLGHYSWIMPEGPLPTAPLMWLIGEGGQRCVQAFFVISGYLMFQSFERSGSALAFYGRRGRRILPGYATVIIFSALGGAFLTRLPLHEYFSPDLLKYLGWNLVFLNFIHPTLPGVFAAQPIHYVNGPLWTLKIEVGYYILFPLLFLIGRRIGFAAWFASLYFVSVAYAAWFHGQEIATGRHVYGVLAQQLPGQLSFFMAGALAAAWPGFAPGAARAAVGLPWGVTLAAALPKRWRAIGLVTAALAVAAFTLPAFTSRAWALSAAIYPAIVAVAVLLACLRVPQLFASVTRQGDLSYGIYIVHFPILQAARSLGLLEQWPLARFCLISALVVGCAVLLWRWVEAPALHYGRSTKPRVEAPQAILAQDIR